MISHRRTAGLSTLCRPTLTRPLVRRRVTCSAMQPLLRGSSPTLSRRRWRSHSCGHIRTSGIRRGRTTPRRDHPFPPHLHHRHHRHHLCHRLLRLHHHAAWILLTCVVADLQTVRWAGHVPRPGHRSLPAVGAVLVVRATRCLPPLTRRWCRSNAVDVSELLLSHACLATFIRDRLRRATSLRCRARPELA